MEFITIIIRSWAHRTFFSSYICFILCVFVAHLLAFIVEYCVFICTLLLFLFQLFFWLCSVANLFTCENRGEKSLLFIFNSIFGTSSRITKTTTGKQLFSFVFEFQYCFQAGQRKFKEICIFLGSRVFNSWKHEYTYTTETCWKARQ